MIKRDCDLPRSIEQIVERPAAVASKWTNQLWLSGKEQNRTVQQQRRRRSCWMTFWANSNKITQQLIPRIASYNIIPPAKQKDAFNETNVLVLSFLKMSLFQVHDYFSYKTKTDYSPLRIDWKKQIYKKGSDLHRPLTYLNLFGIYFENRALAP